MPDLALPGLDLVVVHDRPGADVVVLRGVRTADAQPVLVRTHRSVPPDPAVRDRLRRQHRAHAAAAGEGGSARIAPPLALVDDPLRVALVLADPGGPVLDPAHVADTAEALDLADGLAAALAALHDAGWRHLDLRAEDVVRAADGPVLVGLGDAAEATAPPPAPLGPHHPGRAPERGWLQRTVDHRADQYGLGALLYRCIAGRDPLPATTPEALGTAQVGRRPAPLEEVAPDVPPALSGVVDRLLAADPDGRYRGLPGAARALARCRDRAEGSGQHRSGAAATGDAPTALAIPEGLFGRDLERAALARAWRHAQATGRPHLVVVAGESGTGKSALAADAVDALAATGVVCGEAGFDLLGEDAPLATPARALGQVVDRLLAQPDDRLRAVVASLRSRLGGNTGLALSLLPTLSRLLGLPAAPDPAADADPAGAVSLGSRRHRIDRTVVEVLGGLVAGGTDLAIVLDDLQWADPATLHLLGQLLAEHALGPLLVIATVRSGEVGPDHPLTLARAGWEADGADIADIELGPLDQGAVAELLAQAVGLAVGDTASLARTVVERTGGNALFTRIYLAELAQWELIGFDADRGRWDWDLQEIARQNLAESAPELVRGRVVRTGPAVQQLLRVAAHLDRALALPVLAELVGLPLDRVRDLAGTAEAEGLLRRDRDDRLRFAHDRVRQVLLDELDGDERAHLHLRIGRHLRDRPAGQGDDADLFTVVAQLNRARHLLTDPAERADLLQRDREAAQQAHRRGAYAAALGLQRIALELLPDGPGASADRDVRALRHELLVHGAQNALLAGQPDLIEPWCEAALALTEDPVRRSRANLVLFLHWWQRQQPREMLAALRRTLADLDDPLPARTGVHHVLAEAAATLRAVRGTAPEDLLDRPPSTDPVANAVVRVSLAAANAGYVHDPLSMVLLGLRNTQRALTHGIAPASPYAICTWGFVQTVLLGRVESGYAWSRAAVELGRRPSSSARGATVFMHNAFVAHWARPLATTLEPLQESYREGIEEGDVGYPVAGLFFHDLHALLLGRPLDRLAADLREHADVMEGFHQWSNLQRIAVVRQAVAELRGPAGPQLLDGPAFGAAAWLDAHPRPTDLTLWVHALRGMIALRHGRMAAALAAADAGHGLGRHAPGQAVVALQTVTEGIAWADAARTARGRSRARLLARAGGALARLLRWRAACPADQAHRVALVEAEIAAATGRTAAAMAAYDAATDLAARNGWLSDLGLACDRAAAFHHRRGALPLARHYAQLGLAAHRSWRADGVVASYRERWADLLPADATEGDGSADDRALAQVGRTLGEDMTAEALMGRMLALLVEQSGATAGHLVLPDHGELRVEATAHRRGADVVVGTDPSPVLEDNPGLSAPIVRYVARTRQLLHVNDVRGDRRQRLDPTLHATGVRAVLCLPLSTPGGLTGVVHLANDLAAGAFDADRVEVLRLLSVQAAIAIDNARLATGTRALTRDLEEMRRAADRLADQALTDPLTGLPNRYWLDTRLDEALRLAGEDGPAVSVLYCDLDGFKAVNDTLGHQAGDALLVDMARRLAAAVRPGDTVTRVGGDEFVVLLQSTAPGDGVREVAARIIEACRHTVAVGDVSLGLGVSVGGAVADPGVDTGEALLARADAAMYRAKAEGKGSLVIAGG